MFWPVLVATAAADACPTPAALDARLLASTCPSLTLMEAEAHAVAEGATACFDETLAALQLGRRTDTLPAAGPPPPPGTAKDLRDAYNLPNYAESENFVLRWGSSKSLSSSKADQILDTFEVAWSEILVGMDYVAPFSTDQYKFNLYIGGSGGPSEYGSAYYTSDRQGYPMVVISQGTYDDVGFGATVGAHEFFHALQGDSGARYTYSEGSPGAWYWEATANWVETEIYPENKAENVAFFLIGYIFYPHLPISHFDYPDSGALIEYHQYGAFIFPYYLTREVADASLIRYSWLESSEEDPLVALDTELAQRWETSIAETFFDFAARNATFTRYDDGEVFSELLDQYEQFYGSYSEKIVDEVYGQTGTWREAPSDTAPRSFGTNFVRIDPTGRDLVISFEGAAEGSQGGTPTWDVRAVVVDTGEEVEVPIPLTDGAGEVTVPDSADAREVWLVASVISDNMSNRTETFGWSYRVTGSSEDIDTGEDPVVDDTGADEGKDTKGGCASAGGAPALLLALAGLLGVWRRERVG